MQATPSPGEKNWPGRRLRLDSRRGRPFPEPCDFDYREREHREFAGKSTPPVYRKRSDVGLAVIAPPGHVPTADLLSTVADRIGRTISRATLTRLAQRGVVSAAHRSFPSGTKGGRPQQFWPLEPTLAALADHYSTTRAVH